MMTRKAIALLALSLIFGGCAVKNQINNHYKLNDFYREGGKGHTSHTILVSQPEAMPGLQTEQMLYTSKLFELSPFAYNAWISPPASLLYPLITQSIEHSHYFIAVGAGPNAATADYCLDTQIIDFQQNFLKKPSHFELKVQCIVTQVSDNRVIASKTFAISQPCPSDTPYGGVIGANKAALTLTQRITHFVIQKTKKLN